jgi:hypothetical protein
MANKCLGSGMTKKLALLLIFAVFLSILVGTMNVYAALDSEDFEITMTKLYWANQAEQKETEFTVGVEGDNILSVTLFSPKKKKIFATTFFEEQNWVYYDEYESLNSIGYEYYKIGKPEDMEKKFPLGKYNFTVSYYDTDEKKIKKEKIIRNLTDFPDRPIITYPEHEQTDVELESVITWEKASDESKFVKYLINIGFINNDGEYESIEIDNEDEIEIEDINQTQYQIPTGIFQSNSEYHLWVIVVYEGFCESKSGINFFTKEGA